MALSTANVKVTIKAGDENFIYNNILHTADDDAIMEFAEAINSLQEYPMATCTKTVEKLIFF